MWLLLLSDATSETYINNQAISKDGILVEIPKFDIPLQRQHVSGSLGADLQAALLQSHRVWASSQNGSLSRCNFFENKALSSDDNNANRRGVGADLKGVLVQDQGPSVVRGQLAIETLQMTTKPRPPHRPCQIGTFKL